MKTINNKLAILLVLTFFTLNLAKSQEVTDGFYDSSASETYSHFVIAKIEKEKVVLRWAPRDYDVWTLGNEFGYSIEKVVLQQNPFEKADLIAEADWQYKPLANSPIKPWTIEAFKANIKDSSNLYLGVAMEMLYGEMGAQEALNKGMGMDKARSEQQNRFAYALLSADLNADAALSLGLRFEDAEIKKGEFYYYRIFINHNDASQKTDTVELFINPELITKEQPVSNCMTQAYDGEIAITWTRHNDAYFTAYDIERSENKTNWTKLNRKPYSSSSLVSEASYLYLDTNVVNGKTYFYRLRGYTPFGEKGSYSIVMQSSGVDLTPPSPPFEVKATDQGGVVMITWEANTNESDHDGFFVARSTSAAGGFEKISSKLKKEDRAFVDFQVEALADNYYAVIAVDKSGNEAQSYVSFAYLVDSVAPEPPTGLQGSIDTLGKVILNWNRGSEADIIGYRVYWANDTLAEFSQLTGDVHAHTAYIDSVNIRTLSKDVYYKVVAVDHRYNHSVYSKPIQLAKPDVVPPAAPVIKSYKLDEGRVFFEWINSSSDDVSQQIVERRNASGDWIVLHKASDNKLKSWVDSSLTDRLSLTYRIVAIDETGNKTASNSLEISTFSRGLVSENVQFKVALQDKKATLTWNVTNAGQRVLVYRERSGETPQLLAKVQPDSKKYVDNLYQSGDTYAIKIIYKDGKESAWIRE